ncbi:hypothetical protein HGB13_01080 [bacterium]|nr:hypothetical protein [bacterium]
MKNKLKLILGSVFILPATTFAAIGAGSCPDSLNGSKACPSGGLQAFITTISNTILLIVGVIAVLMLIVGGFQYIASSGNPEQVNKAKNTIFYAIIGIVVTLLAFVAVQFVLGQLTAGTTPTS